MYILSARGQVINKSNKLVYYGKKESKFSKDINGEETSSKFPTNTPRVFHIETTRTRRFHVSPRRLNTEHVQCIYGAKIIIKRHSKKSLLQRVFQKIQLQK